MNQQRSVKMTLLLAVSCLLLTISAVAHSEDWVTAEQLNTARRIIQYNIQGGPGYGETMNWLAEFTDTVGNRMAGKPSYLAAVKYLLPRLAADGFDNVHKEPVQVPNWIRGTEEAVMLSPRRQVLPILGLGSSVGTTGRSGVKANAVVANNFSQAQQLGERGEIRGKILVLNPPWQGYGQTVAYRTRGASVASKYGAVAVLIRSVTPHSIASPHTGQQDYEPGVRKIPAACLTVEDAEMIERITGRGESVVINLRMTSHPDDQHPMVPSWNVLAEITGGRWPEQVVLISGHLDSWDVGMGAMDDGGGVAISRQALHTLKRLGIRPKRTIRAAFWAAEEPGLYGGRQYFQQHKKSKENFTFVMESDNGAFAPQGFKIHGTEEQRARIAQVMPLFEPINATRLSNWEDGGDVNDWLKSGVPGGALDVRHMQEHYFTFHHSQGDSVAVFREGDLDRAAAMWAAVTYLAADADTPL